MVICLQRGADLHMTQLMPRSLTVSCFSKIQIGFTFLVLAHLGSLGQRAIKRVCMCVFRCTDCRCDMHNSGKEEHTSKGTPPPSMLRGSIQLIREHTPPHITSDKSINIWLVLQRLRAPVGQPR